MGDDGRVVDTCSAQKMQGELARLCLGKHGKDAGHDVVLEYFEAARRKSLQSVL